MFSQSSYELFWQVRASMILIINVIKSLPAGMTDEHWHNSDGCSPSRVSRDYMDRFIILNSAGSQGNWTTALPRKRKFSILRSFGVSEITYVSLMHSSLSFILADLQRNTLLVGPKLIFCLEPVHLTVACSLSLWCPNINDFFGLRVFDWWSYWMKSPTRRQSTSKGTP